MNQDNQVKMMCPRCGKEMNINARYCLQCGYLNPNDPANKNMQKFIAPEEKKNTLYQVGSGQSIMQNNNSNQIVNSIASNTGNKVLCFLINYSIYMFIIIFSFFFILGSKTIDFNAVRNSLFPYVALVVSIIFLYVYPMELVFMKANKKWWYALIPFFNLFILSEIVYKKRWLGIILSLPIIGQLFLIVTFYKLAEKFKYSGLLTIIFPIVFIPLMGFGSRLYENTNYSSGEQTLEKDYKRKRLFFVSIMVFLILGGVLIFWNNIIDIKSKAFRLNNYYYVFASGLVVNKTKQIDKVNYFECDSYDYNENKGKYYIEYRDVSDFVYIPFHSYRDMLSAYVVVDNTSGSSKYYISLGDGTYGFPETLYEDVNADTIVPYESIPKRSDVNNCRIVAPKSTLGY